MNNFEIAATFEQMGQLMTIRGDNFHRTLAYSRGAETIRGLGEPLSEMLEAGEDLTKLPGIGKTLAAKIKELIDTGGLKAFEKVKAQVPLSLLDLTRVEGLGGKRVKLIYDKLGITTLDELIEAAEDGRIAELPKMGAKSAEKIATNARALLEHGDDRIPIGEALPLAQQILTELRTLDGVEKAEIGGSLRRMKETIGDVDILLGVTEGTDPAPIMQHFVDMPLVDTIEGQGPTKSSVILWMGMKVDLRVLPIKYWGTLLQYFSGSKEHNVRLRGLATEQGLSLNEYGFSAEAKTPPEQRELCATEEEVYNTLALPYIPPVLREGRGEIEVARKGELPKVVQLSDIRSDLHMHTTYSDGKQSIMEMAKAAQARGFEYIAITDHSQGLGIANGLSVERLEKQAREIEQANAEMGDDFTILHGTEMEIKADATLDFPDDVLAELDFVIASLHVSLKQPREQIMDRFMAAIDNSHVDMIAHPTGRLLGKREGADVDITRLIMAASSSKTILEINANPARLDLNDVNAKYAAMMGVKIAINCDAHATEQFDLLPYGIAVAQRGWITPQQVVNTWPLEKLLAYINK